MSTAAPPPIDPDAVVAAALACPHVAGMSAGTLAEIATYLPGRRVRGVRVGPDAVQVHVVGVYGPSITEIVGQVQAAVGVLLRGRPVTVHVDDLADPVTSR